MVQLCRWALKSKFLTFDLQVTKRQVKHKEKFDKVKAQRNRTYIKHRDKELATNKIYREKNKEKISLKTKEYRENNKDEIKARRSKLETCICGKSYTHDHRARHLRSKKHQDFLKTKEQ